MCSDHRFEGIGGGKVFERIATSSGPGRRPFGIVDRDELGDDLSLPTSTTSLELERGKDVAVWATPPMVWSAPGRSDLGLAPSRPGGGDDHESLTDPSP